MVFFTADTHFYHTNVIQYEHRPFQAAEEMNEALIQNWNARVAPEDDIYILGDLTLKGPSLANTVLARLQGRKYLIRDNVVWRLDVGVDANGMLPVSAADILSFWEEEYGDKAYGQIKPDDIRLRQCPVLSLLRQHYAQTNSRDHPDINAEVRLSIRGTASAVITALTE